MDLVNVLVVDDQPAFRAAARSVIDATEHLVWGGEASTGEDAVELCLIGEFQLVLMDIHMPGIGGAEATRRIRQARPEIRVVLLSSYHTDQLPPEASTCGAASYLHKGSLDPDQLEQFREHIVTT